MDGGSSREQCINLQDQPSGLEQKQKRAESKTDYSPSVKNAKWYAAMSERMIAHKSAGCKHLLSKLR
jgi:hypothetical protein